MSLCTVTEDLRSKVHRISEIVTTNLEESNLLSYSANPSRLGVLSYGETYIITKGKVVVELFESGQNSILLTVGKGTVFTVIPSDIAISINRQLDLFVSLPTYSRLIHIQSGELENKFLAIDKTQFSDEHTLINAVRSCRLAGEKLLERKDVPTLDKFGEFTAMDILLSKMVYTYNSRERKDLSFRVTIDRRSKITVDAMVYKSDSLICVRDSVTINPDFSKIYSINEMLYDLDSVPENFNRTLKAKNFPPKKRNTVVARYEEFALELFNKVPNSVLHCAPLSIDGLYNYMDIVIGNSLMLELYNHFLENKLTTQVIARILAGMTLPTMLTYTHKR